MAKEVGSGSLAEMLCRAFGVDARDCTELHLHIVAGQTPILELGRPAELKDAACLQELGRFNLVPIEEESDG